MTTDSFFDEDLKLMNRAHNSKESLDVIKKMKQKRNEPKDINDIELINSVL